MQPIIGAMTTNSKDVKGFEVQTNSKFTSVLLKESKISFTLLTLQRTSKIKVHTKKSQYIPVRLTADQARIIFLFCQTLTTTRDFQ